jgi:uncharacterized membrane protein
MSEPQAHGWTDERLDQLLGNLLRFGVLLAALVVSVGGIVYLAQRGGQPMPDYGKFGGEPVESLEKPVELRSLAGIWEAVWSGESRGIIQLGIILLIGTPIARVVFSIFAFAMQRDTLYVVVTVVVLVILLYSLLFDA